MERCCESLARLALIRPNVTFTLFDRAKKVFVLKKIKVRARGALPLCFLAAVILSTPLP